MKKKKLKSSVLFVIVIAIVAIVGGLLYKVLSSDNKEDNNNNNNVTTTTAAKKINIVDVNSKNRPYAVMINNLGTARPLQSGLQKAYIMYEMIVEGGLTRYMALFLDQNVDRIGSVRSARHYYLDYALENDAIYIHCGNSPQAKSDFSKLGIDRIEVGSSSNSWRDKSLDVAWEHKLFTKTELLDKAVKSRKFRTERNNSLLLDYSADEIDLSKMENAEVANKISIKYSSQVTSSYEYDAANKVYKRSVNGKAHTDYVTKEQYTFKNIITYQVKNTALNDGSGKDRQTIENVGSGKGYYITNGYAVPITWSKSSRSSQTVYKYEDGKEIDFSDGNTFIQIQPTGQTLSITE